MRAPQTRARAALGLARTRGCGFGFPRICAEPCEPFLSAWTACGFGSQAFSNASAFNANIGAWNTARVTALSSVCAAFRPRGATAGASGPARPGFDAARRGRHRRCARAQVSAKKTRSHLCKHSLARRPRW